MVDGTEECSICYQAFTNKCTTQCQHSFCKNCILQVFTNGQSACPYCRTELDVSLVKLENGEPLVLPPTSIMGGVYIQGNTEGLGSFHFDDDDDCYISYSSPKCNEMSSLSDGSRPPVKKMFENALYNEETRTFTGVVKWAPATWHGDAMLVYTMVFSEDFLSISHGAVLCFDLDFNYTDTMYFEEDLVYKRLIGNL